MPLQNQHGWFAITSTTITSENHSLKTGKDHLLPSETVVATNLAFSSARTGQTRGNKWLTLEMISTIMKVMIMINYFPDDGSGAGVSDISCR